ncbi:putative Xre family DNA-binding protein [Tetragenococcus halophilus subsp. halophilus]|nr:putative Xre family DNA-binding protein [Tetragenococcus halophilus subsp. halophilus]GBD74532.1 putative Xre family DNA-binding protein [Tetragenococcus halophilus subsp. halophilus]
MRKLSKVDQYIADYSQNDPKFKQAIHVEDTIYQLAQTVRQIRKRNGLTQSELAELSGINRVTISKIENADMNPSFALVTQLLNSIQTSIEFKTKNDEKVTL